MNFLTRIRIGPRLLIAFAISVMLLCAVATISVLSIRSINGALHEVTDERYTNVRLVLDIKEQLGRQASAAAQALIVDDVAKRKASIAAAISWGRFRRNWASTRSCWTSSRSTKMT